MLRYAPTFTPPSSTHTYIPHSVCTFFLFLSLISFHTQMLDCLKHTFHISFGHKHHELQSVIQWSCTTNHTFIGILISWMILALTTFIKYLTSEHMMKDLEEDLQTPPPFCNSVSLIHLSSVLNTVTKQGIMHWRFLFMPACFHEFYNGSVWRQSF